MTPADLLSVGLLDTPLSSSALAGVIKGKAEIEALLREFAAESEELGLHPGSPELVEYLADERTALNRVFQLVDDIPDVGRTRAHKLLARKVPEFVPIVDRVVNTLVPRPPGGHWLVFHCYLHDYPDTRDHLLSQFPDEAGAPSTLRLLDVVIWMLGSESGPVETVRSALNIDRIFIRP